MPASPERAVQRTSAPQLPSPTAPFIPQTPTVRPTPPTPVQRRPAPVAAVPLRRTAPHTSALPVVQPRTTTQAPQQPAPPTQPTQPAQRAEPPTPIPPALAAVQRVPAAHNPTPAAITPPLPTPNPTAAPAPAPAPRAKGSTKPAPTTSTPTTTPPNPTPTPFDPRALTDFQLDELTHRLTGRITRLLRTELRLDRERIGRLRDPRT
ncbi:extensin [Streptomyces sp. NPDC001857]|uniref:extensin n=1 Tax=unclassified Streptomyces TaxID=2593676 RepID=UPI003332DCF3